jgi:hypothetical protein
MLLAANKLPLYNDSKQINQTQEKRYVSTERWVFQGIANLAQARLSKKFHKKSKILREQSTEERSEQPREPKQIPEADMDAGMGRGKGRREDVSHTKNHPVDVGKAPKQARA